jgi:hypothetical protein
MRTEFPASPSHSALRFFCAATALFFFARDEETLLSFSAAAAASVPAPLEKITPHHTP